MQAARTAGHLLMWHCAKGANVEYAMFLEAKDSLSEAQLSLVHALHSTPQFHSTALHPTALHPRPLHSFTPLHSHSQSEP